MPAKRTATTATKPSAKKTPVKPRKPVKAARPPRYSHPAFEDLEPQRPGLISRVVGGVTDTVSDLFDDTVNAFANHRNAIVAGAVALLAGIYIGSQTLGPFGDTTNESDRTALYAEELESAVQVAWFYEEDGKEWYCSRGSGTLIEDPTTVLTAAHVIELSNEDEESCPNAYLQVGYAVDPRGEFRLWWDAEVVRSDATLDIAVLKVLTNREPDGATDAIGAIERIRSGDWPVRPVATFESGPNLGDEIHAFAYPGIGGYGATYTVGSAAGWSAIEDNGKSFEYLKLDMTVAGGSSGAGVLNEYGEVIGIVLRVGANLDSDVVTCRKIADTNEDGEVNELDTCVPVGGFINAALSLADIRAYLGLPAE
jgi:S1-C subfamily serine protease